MSLQFSFKRQMMSIVCLLKQIKKGKMVMPNRKLVTKMAAFLSAVIVGMGTVPVYARSEVSVINHVGIGNVNIELTKSSLNDQGEKVSFDDEQVVVPGQTVDEIVEVSNLANDAWIRMKVTFEDSTIDQLDDSLLGISDNWIKRGEYYYYTKPVERGDTTEFMKDVKIPSTWDESLSDKKMELHFTADAVQVKNFTPDFDSDDPWFGTLIEKSVTDEYVIPNTKNDLFSVSYEGGAEGLVKVGDDFFSNWGDLMPGDVVSDTVTVANKYAKSVSIYFRTETIAQDKLLKELNLQIKCDDTVLYDGSMDGEVKNKVLLGTLKNGETKKLTYTLTVPSWLNNPYAMSKTETKWIFTAVLPDDAKNTGSYTGTGIVKTGDSGLPFLIAAAGVIFSAGLIFVLMKERKKNEEV